jgi:hypothetical protein
LDAAMQLTSNAIENCQTVSNENEKKGSLTLSYGKTNSSWHFKCYEFSNEIHMGNSYVVMQKRQTSSQSKKLASPNVNQPRGT